MALLFVLNYRFCEEDIDQILERRTQVIQVESEGKGSTFAKVGDYCIGMRVVLFQFQFPGLILS